MSNELERDMRVFTITLKAKPTLEEYLNATVSAYPLVGMALHPKKLLSKKHVRQSHSLLMAKR